MLHSTEQAIDIPETIQNPFGMADTLQIYNKQHPNFLQKLLPRRAIQICEIMIRSISAYLFDVLYTIDLVKSNSMSI